MTLLEKIKKISFTKNVATLTSGSIFAQLVLLCASPILTRIYKPEEFGVLAAFLTFGYICITISTGSYELAILLPKADLKARKLVRLAIIISMYVASSFLLVLVFTYSYIGKLLNLGTHDWFLLFVPAFVLLNAVFDSLKYYCLRNKMFKQIAQSVFFKALGVIIFQLIFGLLKFGSFGLVLGSVLALLFGNQQLVKVFRNKNNGCPLFGFSIKKYQSEIKRYADFPKFSMPSALLNTTSVQLPVLFFSAYFSASITGFFSLTHRVLSLPMSLLGNAVGDAFVQKANEVKDDKSKLCAITWLLYKTLLIISVVPTAVLFYFGQDLFVFVFGEAWRVSGIFASVLSFWILFVFICSPISKILLVKEKQKHIFVFQALVFISRLLLFFYAVVFKIGATQTMVYFSVLGSLLFFSLIFYILVDIGVSFLKILAFTALIILVGFAPFHFILTWLK